MIEILKYSLPLIGVFVGWGLSQLGDRNKTVREDRRRLKRTIFYLLEIRHMLSLYAVNEREISNYVLALRRKFKVYRDIDGLKLKSLIEDIFLKAISHRSPMNEQDLSYLTMNFLKCVDNLSEIDPLLAHRLQGKQNFKETFRNFSEGVKVSISQLTENIKEAESLEGIISKIEPNLSSKIVADMDMILLELSSKINNKTFKEVKLKLTPIQSEIELAQMEKFIDELFKGILESDLEPQNP